MKRNPPLVYLVALLWCWATILPLRGLPLHLFVGGSTSTPSQYIFQDGFEDTGAGPWTLSNSFNADATTLPFSGSQHGSAVTLNATASVTFSAQSSVYALCVFNYGTRPTSNGVTIKLVDSGVVRVGMLSNAGAVYINANGANSASPSAYTIVNATWYYCLLQFVSGGDCKLWIWPTSSGTTKPTVDGTGGVVMTKTGASGNATGFEVLRANSGGNMYYDDVKISTSEITP